MSEPTIEQVAQAAKARRAQEAVKRESVAANTRANFPNAVAFAELCERRFGKVALKYAEEGGRSIGKVPEPGMDWFATQPYRRGK
jgi:hypothetical protein